MLQFILQLIFLAVYFYLTVSTLYLLVLAIAGNRFHGSSYSSHPIKKKIAVLIPAFKEDHIIVDTAMRAAAHNYPAKYFEVIVIADSLKNETIDKLKKLPVRTLEVGFQISTKAKSLHAALHQITHEGFDIIMILDADNVMQVDCLEKVNASFHDGHKAVQCHRIAKNENNPIALLSAVSEAININLFRKGPVALGLSAAPLGSGMAFDFAVISSIFLSTKILDNPAEDREIEIQLMKRRVRFAFLDDAYVYDEKVTDTKVYEKQRIRWLEAQINHIRRFFKADMKMVPKTATYYHTFFQNLLLPRLIYLFVAGLITLFFLLQWMVNSTLIYPGFEWWLAWMVAYLLVLLLSIPSSFYTLKTLRAIGYLPVLIFFMLRAILKLKANRKEFLHTSKTFGARQ